MSSRPTVRVKITAGLGNQLFQYATGLAVARRLNAELQLDTSYYRKAHRAHPRPLDLDRFGLSWVEGRMPGSRGPLRVVVRALLGGRSRPFSARTEIREKAFTFDPRTRTVTGSCDLEGWFQSPLYFAEIEAEVRTIFDPARFATSRTAELEGLMAGHRNPVAVSVRRGDYKTPANESKHGIVRAPFYDRSRAIMDGLFPDASYFIFSDEAEEAHKELAHWSKTRLVADYDRFEQLHLMACCRHFIIANSSFSWWGAFLAREAGKIVIAPREWFTPPYLRRLPPVDLFPEGWILT